MKVSLQLTALASAARHKTPVWPSSVWKPWEERSGDENSAEAVIHRAKMELGKIRDGFVIPFNMPAIVEPGTATGFDFELIDQAGLVTMPLTQARNQLFGMAAQHPASLVSVRPNGLEDTAQFKLEVDQEKAQALGVSTF